MIEDIDFFFWGMLLFVNFCCISVFHEYQIDKNLIFNSTLL
jgi:hypothetical protein